MTSKKPKLIARSTRFFHPQYAPSFFSQQNSDAAASKAQGAAAPADGKSDGAKAAPEAFPFYQTTSGNAFGYNFRAQQQQADANYLRAPMPGHQICDTELATAPLFRRGADGIRQLYGDEKMDAKKSQLVHPPVRPHVPASEPEASHARRKFGRTYAFGATQTPTQALAHAQAQLSFTAGDGTTVVSAAASAAAAQDGAGGATTAALRGKGHATTFLPPLPKTPPKEVQSLVAPDKLWVSPNTLK